jgi:hypothetical protein
VSFDNKEKGKQTDFFSRAAEKCEFGAGVKTGVGFSDAGTPP